MTTVRAAVVQMRHRATISDALTAAARLAVEAASAGAEIVLLPEYFFAPVAAGAQEGPPPAERQAEHAEDVRAALRDASADAGAAVAGTVIERREGVFLNTLYVYDSGHLVGDQPKVHPMPREAEVGIAGTDRLEPFKLRGTIGGGLVCADIFYPEAARVLSLRGAEILLNPVMSPYYTPDPTKDARESVYVARAWDSAAFVLKAGGFTSAVPDRGPAVVGRSIIAAPWGLVAKYRDEFGEEIVAADLDLDKLRAFRTGHRGFQARVPKAYDFLFRG